MAVAEGAPTRAVTLRSELPGLGPGTLLSLSVGHAFSDRFVVFGEISGLQAHHSADVSEFTTLQWYGFGPGLRYYVMPANVFISSSLLMSRTGVSISNGSPNNAPNRSSNWGATGHLSVGKEWWVASDIASASRPNSGSARCQATPLCSRPRPSISRCSRLPLSTEAGARMPARQYARRRNVQNDEAAGDAALTSS